MNTTETPIPGTATPTQTPKPKPRRKPGPQSQVTAELVHRVSDRVARGIPIRNALAGEHVTQAAYERHLRRHHELKEIQETAKLRFLDSTIELILSRPGPMLRWLLERRHSDIFAAPRPEVPAARPIEPARPKTEADVPPQPRQTVVGYSQEALEEARRRAQSIPPNPQQS